MSIEGCSFNPKLVKMKEVVLDMLANREDARGIIFVKTKALAHALIAWMKDDTDLTMLNPIVFVGQTASASVGGKCGISSYYTLLGISLVTLLSRGIINSTTPHLSRMILPYGIATQKYCWSEIVSIGDSAVTETAERYPDCLQFFFKKCWCNWNEVWYHWYHCFYFPTSLQHYTSCTLYGGIYKTIKMEYLYYMGYVTCLL